MQFEKQQRDRERERDTRAHGSCICRWQSKSWLIQLKQRCRMYCIRERAYRGYSACWEKMFLLDLKRERERQRIVMKVILDYEQHCWFWVFRWRYRGIDSFTLKGLTSFCLRNCYEKWIIAHSVSYLFVNIILKGVSDVIWKRVRYGYRIAREITGNYRSNKAAATANASLLIFIISATPPIIRDNLVSVLQRYFGAKRV